MFGNLYCKEYHETEKVERSLLKKYKSYIIRIQNLGLPLHYIKEILIMLQFSSNWTIFVKL